MVKRKRLANVSLKPVRGTIEEPRAIYQAKEIWQRKDKGTERFRSGAEPRDRPDGRFTDFLLNLPGVSSIGTRGVLDGDVDLGLCRELTVGDGHVKEQVLPSLERRSKKRRSIPGRPPYAARVTFSSSSTGEKR